MRELAEISEIYLFPIKSLPGVRIEEALITKLGIAHPTNPSIIDRYPLISTFWS